MLTSVLRAIETITPERLGRFLLNPTTRYCLAWLLAVLTALASLVGAWSAFAMPDRADGNRGHTTIDFGGQWLMGRLIVRGQGRHLYDRRYQRQVLKESYLEADEVPREKRDEKERDRHDAENLLTWLMGHDDPEAADRVGSTLIPLAGQHPLGAVAFLVGMEAQWRPDDLKKAAAPQLGGPLYPPINALVMTPFALVRPQLGYRALQVSCVLLAFLAGWGVRQLSGGRIWWPIAATLILLFPGFAGAINLGQNAVLALTILIWGWVFLARGRPVLAGALCGLLAFKPVWAMAFFLIPLLTRRWRMCLAMLGTGVVLALLSLPFVGLQTWFDWLRVGRLGAILYNTDENWIFLSRDLLSIPRRWLLDFRADSATRDTLAATLAGWGLLLVVLETTIRLAVLRGREALEVTGPTAAFLGFGAWLCCFHFMYYDVLLAALPVFLLFTDPGRYLQPVVLACVRLPSDPYFQPGLTQALPTVSASRSKWRGKFWVVNSFVLTTLAFMAVVEYVFPYLHLELALTAGATEGVESTSATALRLSTAMRGPPWHTFAILSLWLWCGVRWLWPGTVSSSEPEA